MRCADCRDGEHENYDEKIELVVVRDPETKRFIKRAWLCKEHRDMYSNDGYEILKGQEIKQWKEIIQQQITVHSLSYTDCPQTWTFPNRKVD